MCWQLALPLLTTAVGTGVQTMNNNTLRDQSEEVARGQREQMALRDKASQRVNDEIQSIAKSNPQAEETEKNNDFVAALQRAKLARGGAGLDSTGGTSARFRDDLGLARTAAEGEGKTLAQQLARIDAPAAQRFREGVGANNTAIDIGMLDDASRARNFLTQMRTSQIRPNAGLDALGQGLVAYGQAAASRAGKPKPVAMSPVTSADFDYMTPYDNGDVFSALARNGG